MTLLSEYEDLVLLQNQCDTLELEETILNKMDRLWVRMSITERKEAENIINKHLED